MHLARVFIRNFRNFHFLETALASSVSCITGENNAGKSNFLFALRLLLDSKLGAAARSLAASDVHSDYDISKPTQVVIAAELQDVIGAVQLAFCGVTSINDLGPTVAFRFRPGQKVREDVDPVTKDYKGKTLTIEDYEPELVFCHDADPRTVEWYQPLGKSLRFNQLQEFTVEYLPALRDVEQDLRQARTSPLEKLLAITNVPAHERQAIEQAFFEANKALRGVPSIGNIATAMQREFDRIAGDATALTLEVGVADPSFAKLTRTLSILFQSAAVGTIDLGRNGLGINNLLYIGMIGEYFAKRTAAAKTPGQLFLIDEPEAHLHPQAQRVLYAALQSSGFQTVLATHSTHIASQAPLSAHVTLVREPGKTAAAKLSSVLAPDDAADIERYLDATRSTLLLARKLILVEGVAEAFLLPPLIKAALELDLDRHFISVVPIHGTHFAPYAALFGEGALKKRCAVVCDGDKPAQSTEVDPDLETGKSEEPAISENTYVRVFRNKTTFERTLAIPSMLPALIATFEELGHPRYVKRFEQLQENMPADFGETGEFGEYGKAILNAAVFHGKGRFAQVLSKHVAKPVELPRYIREAVMWLTEQAGNAS